MQTIVTMKWGPRYPSEYANRMWSAIQRNTTRPTRLVCFTDDPTGVDPGIVTLPLPPIELPEAIRWKGWRKVSLWAPKVDGIEGVCLFMDLDLVITGPIDPFFDYNPDASYCVIENWTQPGQRIGNTSVYRFVVGSHPYLYETLVADPERWSTTYPNSQTYLSRTAKDMEFWPESWCASFKHSLLPRFPFNLFVTPPLPPGTRVVAFTGKPDPDEARDGIWPAKGWKKLYKQVRPTPWIAEHWR